MRKVVTVIGCEFAVSGLVGPHEVCRHYHWSEAQFAVIFPHQRSELQPETDRMKHVKTHILYNNTMSCTTNNIQVIRCNLTLNIEPWGHRFGALSLLGTGP